MSSQSGSVTEGQKPPAPSNAESRTKMLSSAAAGIKSYCYEVVKQPRLRMAKDNQSIFGRMWQVAWIIALVVAGLCITGAVKDLGTTDYIKKLFDECKVFEASCYISLGLFVTYILWGKSYKLEEKLKLWLDWAQLTARHSLLPPNYWEHSANKQPRTATQQMLQDRSDFQ